MTIRWTKRASRQLAMAHAYIATDNPHAADRLANHIVDAIKNLAFYPRAGREGRVKNTRELVIVNTPFIVAYRLKAENAIQVLCVLHGKRRWPENF